MKSSVRRRRNPWPRRIISTTVLLLIVVALVAGLVTLISRAIGPESRRAGQVQTAVQSGQTARAQSGDTYAQSGQGSQSGATVGGVPVCDPQSFQATIALGASPVLIGQGTSFDVTFTNKSNRQCFTTFDQAGLLVDTGGYTVYDTTSCESQSGQVPLLFGPHQSWTGHIAWDGRIYDASCQAVDADSDGKADIADAGGYTARLSFAGRVLTKTPLTFEVRYE